MKIKLFLLTIAFLIFLNVNIFATFTFVNNGDFESGTLNSFTF